MKYKNQIKFDRANNTAVVEVDGVSRENASGLLKNMSDYLLKDGNGAITEVTKMHGMYDNPVEFDFKYTHKSAKVCVAAKRRKFGDFTVKLTVEKDAGLQNLVERMMVQFFQQYMTPEEVF